jgi:hypothetical protein
MSAPVHSVSSVNTFYIAFQPVYLASALTLTLTEPAGTVKTSATVTVAAGAYSTADFATALQAALTAASPNSNVYSVAGPNSSNTFPIAGITPVTYGTSYVLSNAANIPFTVA